MSGETWNVLLPREIHPSGPESIDDIATFTSVSEYDSVDALREDVDRYDAVIDRLIDLSAATIAQADNLKVIAKHGVGVDNIDIGAATERGIVVCNTPGANSRGVAEHAITLLATVRKQVLVADRDIRSGTWERHRYSTPELHGDTLGLLGFGDIGSKTGELARGFGMDVVVYDPYVAPDALPGWARMVDDLPALFEAFSYLRHATQEATLVHVRTPKDPDPGDVGPEERLGELADRLEDWGIETATEVRRGDPATEILESEAEHDPTTILLGSRGHSRLRRLLLGSVSEDVVARANGNVLLVPPARTA